MTLGEKQRKFPTLVAKLIEHIYASGYEMTFGEAWRSPETAAIYAKQGKGIATSLHISRLAIDILLYKDGVWLKNTEQYTSVGKFWETLSGEGYTCAWGGRFKSLPDGGHFSIEHDGRK